MFFGEWLNSTLKLPLLLSPPAGRSSIRAHVKRWRRSRIQPRQRSLIPRPPARPQFPTSPPRPSSRDRLPTPAHARTSLIRIARPGREQVGEILRLGKRGSNGTVILV